MFIYLFIFQIQKKLNIPSYFDGRSNFLDVTEITYEFMNKALTSGTMED